MNDAFRTGDLKNLKEDHNPYIKVVGKGKDLLLGKKLKDLFDTKFNNKIIVSNKILSKLNVSDLKDFCDIYHKKHNPKYNDKKNKTKNK